MTFPSQEGALPSPTGPAERSVELFPIDRPLRPTEIIGRDDEVTALVSGLESGVPQTLIGADKSGKTSVADAAAATCERSGWTVVRVDLFRQPSLERFVLSLVPGELPGEVLSERPTISAAIAQLDAEAAHADTRVLLLIDSFDELMTTHIFGKPADTATELRAALSAAPHLRCLLVGGAPSSIRSLFAKDQPFHRFGPITMLPDIAGPEWRAGLAGRFEQGGCPLTDDAADLLVAHGECHARTTMLIAQHTYALAAGHRLPAADATAVEAGAASAAAAERSLADHHVARIRSLSKHALTTVIRVATGESPYKNLPPAMARQTLRLLEAAGIIDRPKSGTYRVVDPMLRRHVLAIAHGDTVSPAVPSIQLHTISEPTVDAPPPPVEQPPPTIALTTPHIDPMTTAGSDDRLQQESPQPAAMAAAIAAVDDSHGARPYDHTAELTEPAEQLRVDETRPDEVPSSTAAPTQDPAPTRIASVAPQPPALDSLAIVRHPRADEAAAIGDRVALALGAAGDEHDQRADNNVAARTSHVIRHAVTHDPQQYWQVEIGDRAVGGVVLRAPGAIIGRGTSAGIDPIGQAAFAALTGALLVAGLMMLVVRQAWNWGAFAGLLFAAFIAATVQLATLTPRIATRARASWTARRNGGHLVEALWSEPDALLPVFRELAQALPGTHLSGCADTPAQATALREIGFCVQRNRFLDGVLDPDAGRPVTTFESALESPVGRRRPPHHVGTNGVRADARRSDVLARPAAALPQRARKRHVTHHRS